MLRLKDRYFNPTSSASWARRERFTKSSQLTAHDVAILRVVACAFSVSIAPIMTPDFRGGSRLSSDDRIVESE
jgi:hypothetical protein